VEASVALSLTDLNDSCRSVHLVCDRRASVWLFCSVVQPDHVERKVAETLFTYSTSPGALLCDWTRRLLQSCQPVRNRRIVFVARWLVTPVRMPFKHVPQSGPPRAAKRSAGLLRSTSVSYGVASCSRWRSVPKTPGQPPRQTLTAKRTDRARSGPAARDKNDELSLWYHPRC
jgi:hypothetical protein